MVEVLRGTVTDRKLTDNAWPFAKFRPLVADGTLYILSAWGISANQWVKYPMVYVASLVAVERSALTGVRSQVAAASYDEALEQIGHAAEQIARARAAWSFHEAPHAAEVQVGVAAEEATGCGGHHYTMVPVDWLRGEVEPSKLGTLFAPPATFWQSGTAVTPYLFYGGGHCYYGRERMGDRFLAAGWHAGGHPAVVIEASDETRAQVLGWMQSGLPRFAARPVEDDVFTADRPGPSFEADPAGTAVFEPALHVESLAGAAAWTRFEVVRRRSVELTDGSMYTWIHCRLLPDQIRHAHRTPIPARPGWQVAEWTFEGTNMPDWQPGSVWWGASIGAGHGGAWGSSFGRAQIGSAGWADQRLFFESSFLPGDDDLDLDRLLSLARLPFSIRER